MPVVHAIHVAPGRRLPMKALESVDVEAGAGLVGDRYHGARNRQVTVQALGQLEAAAVELGRPIDPVGTRRNITVDGDDVPTRPGSRLRIGDVEFEVFRDVPPCRLLDDDLGQGAMEAFRGRGGAALRVLSSGTIHVGDRLVVLPG